MNLFRFKPRKIFRVSGYCFWFDVSTPLKRTESSSLFNLKKIKSYSHVCLLLYSSPFFCSLVTSNKQQIFLLQLCVEFGYENKRVPIQDQTINLAEQPPVNPLVNHHIYGIYFLKDMLKLLRSAFISPKFSLVINFTHHFI